MRTLPFTVFSLNSVSPTPPVSDGNGIGATKAADCKGYFFHPCTTKAGPGHPACGGGPDLLPQLAGTEICAGCEFRVSPRAGAAPRSHGTDPAQERGAPRPREVPGLG